MLAKSQTGWRCCGTVQDNAKPPKPVPTLLPPPAQKGQYGTRFEVLAKFSRAVGNAWRYFGAELARIRGVYASLAPLPKLQNLALSGSDYPLIRVGDQLLLAVVAVGRQKPMMPPLQVRKHRELTLAG